MDIFFDGFQEGAAVLEKGAIVAAAAAAKLWAIVGASRGSWDEVCHGVGVARWGVIGGLCHCYRGREDVSTAGSMLS